jgi:phenylalanyl-tRNA synthetase beta chain
MIGYLQALDIKVKEDQHGESYSCEPPSYRPTMAREIDLIEEIVRLHGFKNTGTSNPVASMNPVRFTPRQKVLREIRDALCHLGYSESVNYSFIEDDLAKSFVSAYGEKDTPVIQLNNPISNDMGTMRTSLIPGLLKVASRNLNKGQKPVKIFETGRVYFKDSDGKDIIEKESIAVLATGTYENDVWKDQGQSYGFYDLKGTSETLINLLNLSGDYIPGTKPFLDSGKTVACQIKDETIAVLGELSSNLAQKLGFEKPVYVFELDLQALAKSLPDTPRFSPIPKFPETYRDISILIDKSVTSKTVRDLIRSASGPLINKVELFDQYEGEKLEKGKKSLTLALSFQSPERTLTDNEINPLFENVVEALKDKLGAKLRE